MLEKELLFSLTFSLSGEWQPCHRHQTKQTKNKPGNAESNKMSIKKCNLRIFPYLTYLPFSTAKKKNI